MQGLPVGVQSFEVIRKDNLVYVDKTKHIYDLVNTKGAYYFFLSRPRRFGKSLLVSTLKELFLGNKHMFESLWIAQSDYNWKVHHVMYLDFSLISSSTIEEFRDSFSSELDRIAQPLGVNLGHKQRPADKLKLLIDTLENVVILIDEYDRPLLQHVDNIDVMKEIQSILRDFYAIIKGLGNKIPFLFMTGITKFSKTSIFSGLNNLIDLSFLPNNADLLGYTDAEIDHYFQPHMQAIAQKQNTSVVEVKNAMRHWYNGYQFSKEPQKVYNPFSVLMYLFTQELRNFWFETGTPSFLVSLIKAKQYNIENFDRAEINIGELEAFEIDDMQLIPLLFQTGYLTIRDYDPMTRNFQLAYPNEETKASFLQYFMRIITTTSVSVLSNTIFKLIQSLETGNVEEFFSILKVFFAAIPYTMQLPQEKYYQSIFYVIMNLVGAYTQAEVVTNDGRIDCTITNANYVYIFEFKLYDTATSALEQIHNKKYYQKFLHDNKSIILVGAAFDVEQRNISGWVAQELQ